MRIRRALLLLAAALALADASIVTLALPPIIDELDASVEGAAAVLGVYTLVLAVALPFVPRLRARPQTLGALGAAAFAAASLGCGLAGSLEFLLVLRALQAAAAAVVLVAVFALVDGGGAGRRAWHAAAVFGFAAGPALGGALTQALDWRAIFLAQVPIVLAASVAAATVVDFPAHSADNSTTAPVNGAGPASLKARGSSNAATLALVSAALTGVLFLLVLLLVTGWSTTPLAAAATVTVLPIAAIAAARIPGEPTTRAAAGALLIAGGVGALASVPEANVLWTIPPQVMAGVGMGLALPALATERTAAQAANLLAARHAGITIALAILAPIAAARIDGAVATVREQGTALVLDARLPPLDKLELADTIVGDIDPVDPRGQLQRSLDRASSKIDKEDRPAYAELFRRADEALVAGVQSAFVPAFAVCAALALLAALLLRPRDPWVIAAAIAAVVLAGGAYIARPSLEPEPVTIANPCRPRHLPSTGGIDGALQDVALTALDRAACRYGSSREELALALVDSSAREAYQRDHGVDPRDILGIVGAALGI
ncbi:MAG TPA: MFS transporter [Solirubrobacteraceae bacterium]|nr:MFS transporter [Solirubrobacteraceae bacterium]